VGEDISTSHAAVARAVIDANQYMTLATADTAGRPWACPVWFAHRDYREFIWLSRPGARHSVNLAGRREVAIVIFDSTAAPRDRQAVYVEGVARELSATELDERVDVYSRRSVAAGLEPLGFSAVTRPAEFRLYGATASACFVLDEDVDRRIPVSP
jgi:nitroimidazol reductase NimA-like FMN-containing flavoprotein (pyridoxamine 5'-phosphate oxidase superfamily)